MRLIIVMLWIGAMMAMVLALVFVSSPPLDSTRQVGDGYSLVDTLPSSADARISLR